MKLYGSKYHNITCQNQQRAVKRNMEETLIREVNQLGWDTFFSSVRKALTTFEKIYTALLRKVTFMDLLPVQGEQMDGFIRRMDTVAEVAEHQIFQVCKDKDLRLKIIELKGAGKDRGESL